MCGIFGMVVQKGEKPDQALVKKATDQLFHRGPDSGNCFFEQNLALGHRRLAILDLSDSGQQPMHRQDLTITYNGELYNYLELRTDLRQKGYVFQTNTDTEVVLAAYQEWGTKCVHQFNGMWAFAIYDAAKSLLFCSRDRFGIKPFYYTFQDNNFAFASEVKALSPLPFWQAKLNLEMANDYLIKGLQNHTDQTLFKNTSQLSAGHHLIFDLKTHRFEIEQYYDVSAIPVKSGLSFEQTAIQFQDLLKDAIRLHSRSDVKVGAALSGGLDSSSIVALQSELLNKSKDHFEVVSYASEIPKFDESPYVDALLKRYPFSVHKTSATFEETIEMIDEVILAHDEPLLSASLVAQYAVFKMAKSKGLKVMLDGQGADELLAGYGTYYVPFLKDIGPSRIFQLLPEIWGMLRKHQIKFNKKLSFFKRPPSMQQYLKCAPPVSAEIGNGFQAYCHYMIQKGILPALLQFEDRSSMAHSVESRVPFLDYRLVEFCMSLPANFKIRKGVRKAILREGLKNHLPPEILHRYDKMGFSTPQESWMSENPKMLFESLQNTITKHANLFEKDLAVFAQKVLSEKQTAHYPFLWRIMTFGRWLDLLSIQQ